MEAAAAWIEEAMHLCWAEPGSPTSPAPPWRMRAVQMARTQSLMALHKQGSNVEPLSFISNRPARGATGGSGDDPAGDTGVARDSLGLDVDAWG